MATKRIIREIFSTNFTSFCHKKQLFSFSYLYFMYICIFKLYGNISPHLA